MDGQEYALYCLALAEQALEESESEVEITEEEKAAFVISLMEEGVEKLNPREHYEIWVSSVSKLALLYLKQPDGASAENVEKTVELGRRCAAIDPGSEIEDFMSGVFFSLGEIQTGVPEDAAGDPDPSRLTDAIRFYTHALAFSRPDEHPGTVAVIHLKLAMCYQQRWPLEPTTRRESSGLAIQHARQAETFFTEQRAPKEWGLAQFILGVMHTRLGEGNQEENLVAALFYMERVLRSPIIEENPDIEIAAHVTLAIWQMFAPGTKSPEEKRKAIDAHIRRAAALSPPEQRPYMEMLKAMAYGTQSLASNPRVGMEDAASIITQMQSAVRSALQGPAAEGAPAQLMREAVTLQIVLWHNEMVEEMLAGMKLEEPHIEREINARITDGDFSYAVPLVGKRRPDLLERGWKIVEEAIPFYRSLVESDELRSEQDELAQVSSELALVYTIRRQYFSDRVDLAETRRLEQHYASRAMSAMLAGKGRALSRLMSGKAAGFLSSFLERRWDEAEKFFGIALSMLEQEYESSVTESTGLGALRRGGALSLSLVLNQAYTLARLDRARDAVLLLEKWRGKQLAESIEVSDSLSALVREDDRRDFDRLSGQIKALQERQRPTPAEDYAAPAQQLRHLREQRQQVVERIRSYLPEFLSELSFDEIRRLAAPDKPLIYALYTELGSLLLVVPREGEPSCLWYDGLTKGRLASLLYYDLLPLLQDFSRQGMSRFLAEELPSAVGGLVRLLRECLARQNAKGVYLIPCGALPVLPLHAVPDSPQSKCLVDDFEVHYVPNARTLRAARQRLTAQQAAPPRLTVVGNPTGDLSAASFEAEEVAALFSTHPTVSLIGDAATYAAVAGALPSSTHVHLACHGRADMESPLDSALLLARGERLSLKAVLERTLFDALSQARLVVLSACQTALVEVEHLPEELMGLHAGFLQAGVPGVVGTLWSVNDISTAYLMIKFYQNLLAPERPEPAAALRHAQLWLRDATDDDLDAFCRSLGSERAVTTRVREAQLVDLDPTTHDTRRFANPYFWAGFVFVGT